MQHRLEAPDAHSTDELEIHPELDEPSATIARLPGIATQLIGERIRKMYAALIREPVPDDLLKLIRQLESKEYSE